MPILRPPPIKSKITDVIGMLARPFSDWFRDVHFYFINTNSANQFVSLDLDAKLPAIDGSQLTNIDHVNLENKGTNTHAQIDSHISSIFNPHSVTKTQVGLGNVPDVDCTNATNIISGTLADARLSSNVALKNQNNNFSETQNVTGNLVATGQIKGATGQIGGVANYSEFETDGTLVFNGDATTWEDLNFSPLAAGGPAVTLPDYVTINNVVHREFTSSNNQYCGDCREIPHEAKLGQTLIPHAHIFLKSGESSGTTGVTFTIYWEIRDSTGTTSGSVALSATSAELAANGNKVNIYDATGFTGSSELGAQLNFKIARTAGDAGDVILMTFGVHYEKDATGSRAALSK